MPGEVYGTFPDIGRDARAKEQRERRTGKKYETVPGLANRRLSAGPGTPPVDGGKDPLRQRYITINLDQYTLPAPCFSTSASLTLSRYCNIVHNIQFLAGRTRKTSRTRWDRDPRHENAPPGFYMSHCLLPAAYCFLLHTYISASKASREFASRGAHSGGNWDKGRERAR